MKQRIPERSVSDILTRAIEISIINREEDTAVMLYDLDFLQERLDELNYRFPENSLHAIAAKANPLIKMLEIIKASGFGIEVASLPELYLAERTGFPVDKIVFDSPSKTKKEIKHALDLGIRINADSFSELERIKEILDKQSSTSPIGIRIKPHTGTGAIESTSVSGKISKFGIPIDTNRDKIIDFILNNNWVSTLHLHIGSQGIPINMLVEGTAKLFHFIRDINKILEAKGFVHRIRSFDIGGGLAVSYHPDSPAEGLAVYREKLESAIPGIFNGELQIITEFGRYIHANTAWVASKVEYVKKEKDYHIIMTHLGADFFLRKCYNPEDWHHHISIADQTGRIKTGNRTKKYIIAGPLCFAGDVIAKDIELPEAKEGDYIIVYDVGAYNLSMWSRYNSRQIPMVLGYSEKKNEFSLLKKRETPEDLYQFWK